MRPPPLRVTADDAADFKVTTPDDFHLAELTLRDRVARGSETDLG